MSSLVKSLAFMLVGLFFIGLVTVLLPVPVNAASTWNIQTLDKNAAGGGDIVLDSNNRPQILYPAYQNGNYSDPSLQLMYANWTGSVWSIRALALFDGYYNFVLDSKNFPQILCRDGSNVVLWNGTNWSKQIITGDNVQHGFLALDSAGDPHVAYTTDNGNSANPVSLKYASWTGTNWSIQTIDTFNGIYNRVYMGLDSSKNPHMMYGNETDYILPPPDSGENILLTIRFANWNGSTWNKQTVFSNVSTYGNMILDSKGYPHFIYTQAYQPQNAISSLNYASWNGSSWNSQTVISNANVELGYLALDAYDYPHLDFFNDTLMYAQWTGSGWDIQSIGPNANGIQAGPMVIRSNGNVYVTYSGHDWLTRIGYGGYAYATEPIYTPTPSPTPTAPRSTSPTSPLIIALTAAVAIVIIVTFVYFLKKKTRKAIS